MKPEDLLDKTENELTRLEIACRKVLSDQQRRFGEFVVSGMSNGESYQEAGYKSKTDNVAYACGSRLLRNAKVSSFVNVLREKLRRNTLVDPESMIRRFLDAGDQCMKARAFSAAKSHWREAALLADLYPALRKHLTIDDKTVTDTTQLSDDAWEALFNMRLGKIEHGDNPTTH